MRKVYSSVLQNIARSLFYLLCCSYSFPLLNKPLQFTYTLLVWVLLQPSLHFLSVLTLILFVFLNGDGFIGPMLWLPIWRTYKPHRVDSFHEKTRTESIESQWLGKLNEWIIMFINWRTFLKLKNSFLWSLIPVLIFVNHLTSYSHLVLCSCSISLNCQQDVLCS